jgi:hypothetical protein
VPVAAAGELNGRAFLQFILSNAVAESLAYLIMCQMKERPPLNEDPRDGGDRDEEDICDED